MAAPLADSQVVSLAAGFTLGFGVITVWEATKQTIRNKNPLRSTYIWMIWGEFTANLVLGILCYLFIYGVIPAQSAVAFVMMTWVCWVVQILLLLEIIINRIGIIHENPRTVNKIKWGTAVFIILNEIFIIALFLPAFLQPQMQTLMTISMYWNKMYRLVVCFADAALNWYFLHTVKQLLIKRHGLKKYTPLVRFNAKLMILSICMDFVLFGLMFLPNKTENIQFHPAIYMMKLNIEIAMANLIHQIAHNRSANSFYRASTSTTRSRAATTTTDDGYDDVESARRPRHNNNNNNNNNQEDGRELRLTTYPRPIKKGGQGHRPISDANSDDSGVSGDGGDFRKTMMTTTTTGTTATATTNYNVTVDGLMMMVQKSMDDGATVVEEAGAGAASESSHTPLTGQQPRLWLNSSEDDMSQANQAGLPPHAM